MKRKTFLDSLRNLIPAMPQLAPATGGLQVQFASSGGGGGRDDDDYPDDDFYEEELPEEEGEPAPRRERRPGRRPTAARQRTVQTDPDERYWTDYLRIALPVIGLLLVIAVFWYWAQQLIDNDSEDLSPTAPGLAEVVDTPEETETPGTPTPPAGNIVQPQAGGTPSNPLQAIPSPTPTGQQPPAQQQQQAPSTPTEEPATTGAIAPDTTVTVVEDVNLRSEPTAQVENVVVVLPAGTALTVLSGPEEAEGYVWWQVVDPATANQGWVVEEFIQPAA